MLTLAACARHHKPDVSTINDANANFSSAPAQTSGIGQETGFGDRDQRGGRRSNGRVFYFDFDSYVVHEADRPAIVAQANFLMAHPRAQVMLEGHTDPRGSREYNIALGERRAKAVAQIMRSRGVNPSQIRIVSYGAEKLASPGRTDADFARDRRVVIVSLRR